MKPYKLKIAANTAEQIFFGNDRNYVHLDVNSLVDVTLKDNDNNQEYTLRAGDDVLLNSFNELEISHSGKAESTILIYVGKDTKASNAQVSGVVEVVNSSVVAAMNNQTFRGGIYTSSAVGNYPFTQLHNPVGSGIDVYVSKVAGVSNIDSVLYLGFTGGMLNAAGGGAGCKKSDGIASKAIIKSDLRTTGVLSATLGEARMLQNGNADLFSFEDNLIIKEGWSLTTQGSSPSSFTTIFYEFMEVEN